MSAAQTTANLEGAVIICCDGGSPEDVIRQIIGCESSLPKAIITDNVRGYPWLLETRYYKAEVNLYALEMKKFYNSIFSDSIRATIFYFDSQKPSSFEEVLSWMPFLEKFNSEVQLMVCDHCSQEDSDSDIRKSNVIDWCIANNFELIELGSTENSDSEDDAIVKDSTGYSRIIEALEAHTWANLVLNDTNNDLSERLCDSHIPQDTENLDALKCGLDCVQINDKMNPESLHSEGMQKNEQASSLETSAKADLSEEDQSLFDIVSQVSQEEGESFEALFEKFAQMKEKASELTGQERKKYAEKVAIAFWKAVGGDEEEIAGLDDDKD